MKERTPVAVRSAGSGPTINNREYMCRIHTSVVESIQTGFVIESKVAVVYQL
jgi:hypothetical protein